MPTILAFSPEGMPKCFPCFSFHSIESISGIVLTMSVFTSGIINITASKTIHILKAYDESYSKIIKGHKYKDKDNNKDKDKNKDKDTDKVPEKPNICYIFEILMTYSFQI